MKFRKLPVVIEATRWFENGDHPQDDSVVVVDGDKARPFLSEGRVVRRYRERLSPGFSSCEYCGRDKRTTHGWIDTSEGGHVVCPGDWVVTGVAGERYPVKDAVFRATYEEAKEE